MFTDTAHVNVRAAVNYHFGGKDKLVRAVIERRMSSLEAARGARLDAVKRWPRGERARADGRRDRRSVGWCLLSSLENDSGWRHFIRLVSRLPWEPGIEEIGAPPEGRSVFALRLKLAGRHRIWR